MTCAGVVVGQLLIIGKSIQAEMVKAFIVSSEYCDRFLSNFLVRAGGFVAIASQLQGLEEHGMPRRYLHSRLCRHTVRKGSAIATLLIQTGAALPPHSAERLCLSGARYSFLHEAPPQREA
jgi:hypothetical protein